MNRSDVVEVAGPLRTFTWRGFGLAWDSDERVVETRHILAAVSERAAMLIRATWQLHCEAVETIPLVSQDPEQQAVALKKPGAIFWQAPGMTDWQELTKDTPRLPPSTNVMPTIPTLEDPEDAALFAQVRDALTAGQSAAGEGGKRPFVEALMALAQMEERVRQRLGTVAPFLELARDRIDRKSYEPIPLKVCHRLLATHRHAAQRGVATSKPAADLKRCNWHEDCDAAEAKAAQEGKPVRFGASSVRLEHCNDDTCEDCFGS